MAANGFQVALSTILAINPKVRVHCQLRLYSDCRFGRYHVHSSAPRFGCIASCVYVQTVGLATIIDIRQLQAPVALSGRSSVGPRHPLTLTPFCFSPSLHCSFTLLSSVGGRLVSGSPSKVGVGAWMRVVLGMGLWDSELSRLRSCDETGEATGISMGIGIGGEQWEVKAELRR
jgi:hypothetical protein